MRAPNHLKSLILFAFVVLVSCLSFLAGYASGHHAPSVSASSLRTPPVLDTPPAFGIFWEAWGWVEREYFDRDAIDPIQMTHGAIRGMLQSLGDPHTSFVDPKQRAFVESQLQGGFDGIGVQVEMTEDGRLVVVAPQDGSPGELAGIRAGDVITHVDGSPITGLSLLDAVSRIRGPRGTTVTLSIERDGSPEAITMLIRRAEIKVESARARLLEEGVAYVRLSQFGAQTKRELREVLEVVLRQKPAGLVLDLRGNRGGYLATAVDVASEFLANGVVLHEVRSGGQRQLHQVKPGGIATSIPMVVLVDRGTASASEIVAGALQDHQRALLVGEVTFGKGSMQTVHVLSDGSGLHVTTARWLTPAERPIDQHGLLPDLIVERRDQTDPEVDLQLRTAVGILTGRM